MRTKMMKLSILVQPLWLLLRASTQGLVPLNICRFRKVYYYVGSLCIFVPNIGSVYMH